MSIGSVVTYKYMTGQIAKDANKGLVQVIEKKDNQNVINDNVATNQIQQAEKIRTVYKTITKEVIKYEKENPNASVQCLDPEWVQQFNESAGGKSISSSADGAETTMSERIKQLTK